MISGKCFADLCRWVVDPRYPHRELFNYSRAVDGDWVFVNGNFMYEYIIRVPFLHTKFFNIIVHNSDRPFTYEVLKSMRAVRHVYAINTTFRHPKVSTIPIGFVDKQLPFLETFRNPNTERDIEIYMNFTIGTNTTKRNECVVAFQDDRRVVCRTNLSLPDYYSDLCRSKFVLCPEGTGIDTHRVYESILCGATPVVLRNSLSHLYEKLPVCIVDSWKDVFVKPSVNNILLQTKDFL